MTIPAGTEPPPLPPGEWFRRIKDLTVLAIGAICLLSQVVGYLLGLRPSVWLIFAGLTCFGYQLALTADRAKLEPAENPHAPD